MSDLSADEYKATGEWLTETYRGQGYSQTSLAKACDLSPSLIRSLEYGGRIWKGEWVLPNPSPANLYKLAAALHLPASEVGAKFGKTLRDITPPADSQPVTAESVAADVRAVRTELQSHRALLEQLLDRLPPR